MKPQYYFVFGLLMVFSCKPNTSERTDDYELKELFTLMQGSFSSELQAQQDSSYYNISLHMYPIWEDKGYFLYVEQALFNSQENPYRQRIYEVSRHTDSTFISAVYTLKVDSIWTGKWKTPAAFTKLSLADLNPRKGCEVILKRIEEAHFQGQTEAKACLSELRGASYATSEVVIRKDKIVSWDRGYNSADEQVWGAKKAGYIFDRIQN